MNFSLKAKRHAFHLVDASFAPFLTSVSALTMVAGSVFYFQGFYFGAETSFLGFFGVAFCMFLWWRDVIREGTLEGRHTNIVQLGLRYGMVLFIVSEVMFFFAFFWAFFAACLSPTIDIGNIWPPKGLDVFCAFAIPLLNTLILLCSGATVTFAHHAITSGRKLEAFWGLVLTITLATVFTALQAFEYVSANFSICDGIYGSTFFMTTGFHGFHVFVGTCFLAICLSRLLRDHFTAQHNFGFEAAVFYWHFVDVVWLFLYIAIYFWGGH
jgi:heme/copper-type cytochrome/quinol oxidase subunit 3